MLFCVALRHGLEIAAAVKCRETVGLAKGIESVGKCRRYAAEKYRDRNQDMATTHGVASISEGTAVAKFQRSLRVCRNKGTPGLGNVRHSTNYILVRKFHSGL